MTEITEKAAYHIFTECFIQYDVLVEADPGKLALHPRMQDFVFDFDSVSQEVLTPLELKLFKMRVKYKKRRGKCLQELKIDVTTYTEMRQRIKVKLGRGFHDHNLWPLENYFNDNHAKKVRF